MELTKYNEKDFANMKESFKGFVEVKVFENGKFLTRSMVFKNFNSMFKSLVKKDFKIQGIGSREFYIKTESEDEYTISISSFEFDSVFELE